MAVPFQQEFYERTKNLIKGVVNAKSQAVLRECWGKMYGDDGQVRCCQWCFVRLLSCSVLAAS